MAKKSRLIEIMESRKSGGKSDLDALAQAIGPRILESLDIRGALFGKKGTSASGLGQVLGRAMFGAGYSATTAKRQTSSIERTQRVESIKTSRTLVGMGRSLANIDKKMTLVAKNSISQNAMARDMNVMRQNIGKMTKHMTGSYRTKADMQFMNSSKRNSAYNKQMSGGENSGPTNTIPTTPTIPTAPRGSFFGGIGSVLTGILGGTASIGGSVISGLLRAVPFLGIAGIISTGFLLKNIGETVDFKGFGKALGEDFSQIGDGLLDFFGFGKNGFFTNMFKTKEGDEDKPSFIRMVAGKLDHIFNTSIFSSSLDKAGKFIEDAAKSIKIFLEDFTDSLYEAISPFINKATAAALASFDIITESFDILTHNIQASVFTWLDSVLPGSNNLQELQRKKEENQSQQYRAIGELDVLDDLLKKPNLQIGVRKELESQRDSWKEFLSIREKEGKELSEKIEARTTKSFSTKKSLKASYEERIKQPLIPESSPFIRDLRPDETSIVNGGGARRMASPDLNWLPSGFNWENYKKSIGSIESGNDYGIINKLGFLGRYQFGIEALMDLGFIKGDAKKNNKELEEPSNWTGEFSKKFGINSMEDFLNRPDVQDWAFANYTARNYKRFKNEGIIKEGMPQDQIAQILATGGYGIGHALQYWKTGQDLQGQALAANPGGYSKYLNEFDARWSGKKSTESVNITRYNPSMFTAASEAVDNAPVIINNFYNDAKQKVSDMSSQVISTFDSSTMRDIFSNFLGARTSLGGFSGQ